MAKIKLRRDTAANWSNIANNPILASGEPGYETDTGRLKIGNGATAWNSLPYFDDQQNDYSAVTQSIIPDADNAYDLGSPSNQWRDIFVAAGSIYIGDVKLSNDGGTLLVQQVTDPGTADEEPVPDTPGVVTTNRLVNGNKNVTLNAQGDLILPAKFPIQFTAVFDAAHYNGVGTFQGDGTASFNLELAGAGNEFQWLADDPVFETDRGYVGQQAFRYTEADHGITGYNLDILMQMNGSGPYSLQVALSPVPSIANLAKIRSTDELMIRAGNQGWLFDVQGDIYLPSGGDIRDSLGNSVLGGTIEGIEITQESNTTILAKRSEDTVTEGENSQTTITESQIEIDPTNLVITKRITEISDDGVITTTDVAGSSLEVSDSGAFVKQYVNPAGPSNSSYFQIRANNGAILEGVQEQLEGDNYGRVTATQGVVTVNTAADGIDKEWLFDSDGNITLPNSGMIRTDESNIEIGNINNFNVEAEGVVNIYTSTASETPHQWQFGDDGNLNLPEGGDILDSEGNSVLGSGTVSVGNGDDPSVQQVSEILFNGTVTEIGPNVVSVDIDPTIPNTKRGFINLVGDRPNEDSTIGFSTVAVWGDYAYVLGSDFYFTSSTDKTKVYKFDLRTGEQVWVKQIRSSRGAEFDLTIGSGTVTLDLISDSGTGYKVGEEIVIRGGDIGGSNPENDVTIIVDTIDGSGGINTASIKPGYDVTGLTGTYTNITIQRDDIEGDTCAIAYSPIINKVLAVSEYWTNYGNNEDSNWNWANLYVIDPVTGVIDVTVTLSDEGDIYPNSIDVTSVNGDAAIAGEKYNEYREFGTLTLLAGYNGYFDILKEDLDPEHYPGDPYSSIYDYWITGTGITGQNNIDNINYYPGLPTTVREGSGAQFQVVSAGDGIAYVSALATVPNKGINYLVGHKIKILGTDLGGVTPGNDATITVTEIGTGGSIEAVTISGTAGDTVGVGGTYNGLTGTNYNVGSGSIVTLSLNNQTGSFDVINIDNTGLNYVVGDVLTVAGTQFANGATPTHDATLVVNSVDGTGAITGFVGVTGTGQTNALRIFVDGVDFTVEGSWSMRQNLGGEAFVWTANWSNAIGGPSGDRFYDVSWNSDATAIYAVGQGRYEVNYDQALVVKFNALTGAVIWSKDIKFSEATTENRTARAVCMIPGSSDIMVAGAWYNNSSGYDEIILTRISSEGAAVWQKTYLMGEDENTFNFDYEISIKALDSTNVLVSFEQNTNNSQGLAYLKVNATTGVVVLHRVLSSPGNGNYNAHDTATPTFADIYTEGGDDYVIMAGRTYVPTDDSRNALLIKLPVDGLKNLEISERLSLGEHLLTRHDVTVTTVTPAFDSFTPEEHLNTITNLENARNYSTIAPDGELGVWTYTVTDDTAGSLEFGDGSKQSFATNVIPQIPAANSYYLTEQDSGKHLFFEQENGTVYIPHRDNRYFPVGFTFTIVNTSGSDIMVETMIGESNRGRLKLAGRNIDTPFIGIPDSGSGSMVTFLKVKDGYTMDNSDGLGDYPDIWMVSGPGDVYNAD